MKIIAPSFLQTLSAVVLATVFCNPARAGLIGHWPFDESTGDTAADASGMGNDGVITGALWGSDETRDNYLIFAGVSDYVDPAVTLPVMTNSNDFTWAAWVNSQEEIGGTQQNAVIFGNRNDATGADFAPRQFIKLTPTKFEWHQNGNGNDNVDVDDLVFDEWHHIAIVKTGDALEYFQDGISVGTGTLTEMIGTVENPFYIGGQANNASVNEYFNGYIDDVRIYDEALDADAIAAIIAGTVVEIAFTEISVDSSRNIDLTWTSRNNATYALDASTSLTAEGQPGGWLNIDDGIASGGALTSKSLPADMFPFSGTKTRQFFRAREVENP